MMTISNAEGDTLNTVCSSILIGEGIVRVGALVKLELSYKSSAKF